MAMTMEQALEHYSSGRLQDSERACREILGHQPHHAPALHLLAVLAYRSGHVDDAISLVRRAVAISPGMAEYHSNLGIFLNEGGRPTEAVVACRRAVELAPTLAATHYNLGNALRDTGALAAAADAYRRAVTLRFDYVQAHNNLGNVCKAMGELEQAVAAYRQALLLQPDFAPACSSLGDALKDMGLMEEAMEMHRRAVELAPSNPQVGSNLIASHRYDPDADDSAIERECRQWHQRHAQALAVFNRPHAGDRNPDRVLRVGCLCGRPQADDTAPFLDAMLALHGHHGFSISCYTSGRTMADGAGTVSPGAGPRWSSLFGLSDEAGADLIRSDGIDILVDLDGHAAENRLLLLARKPAPVQLAALGANAFPGMGTTDFRVTDFYLDPSDAPPFGAESALHLPDSAWCYAAPQNSAPLNPLPALRNGHVRFVSAVDTLARISPETLRAWSRILQQVPTARLLVENIALRSAQAARPLQRRFAALGIDAARLDLLAPRANDPGGGLAGADIALDTFPVHGTRSTCEAMWMGLPVFTLADRRYASRTGVSLLSNAGHPEMIVHSPDAYVEQAVALATDLPRLSELRATLRDDLSRSHLMDLQGFVHSLGAAYRNAWRQWCARASV